MDADLRDPARILGQAKCTFDPSRPAAVFPLAVLRLIPGADDPAGLVTALAADRAPGSCLAITHLTADFAPRPVTAAVEAYKRRSPYQ